MKPQMDPDTFEDVHDVIYLETSRLIEQAGGEGFECPYTIELYQDRPGNSLVGSCIAESADSVSHWDLAAIDPNVLDQPFTMSLWAKNDKKAKLSRTFRISDHYEELERNGRD